MSTSHRPSSAAVPTSILAASARRGRDEPSKAADAYRRIKAMIVSLELEPASCAYHHAWRDDGLSDHSALEADLTTKTSTPGA